MNHFIFTNTYRSIKSTRGFTLVEILVVLGLFSFIMTLATGSLYATQAVNVKLQESQSMLDNINVSMQNITRDIRYGSNFYCKDIPSGIPATTTLRRSCPYTSGGGNVLVFRPSGYAENDRVSYYASTTRTGNVDHYVILKSEYKGGATTTYQMTSNDVKVNSFIFYVDGAYSKSGVGIDENGKHDITQPIITIIVSGETQPLKQIASSTKFYIETSVSPRILDSI